MTSPIVATAALLGIYVLWKYLYHTDQPKIKGLPEIPGWPIFGSLIELGEYHARVAQKWAAKYGPVFQVRLGNKVRCESIVFLLEDPMLIFSSVTSESSLQTPTLRCESCG
jgi:hypothetical protein